MISIGNVLIGDEITEQNFICDLSSCKGGCCENGAAGAPLEENEVGIINEVYEQIKPYLSKESINEIEKQGKFVSFGDYEYVTPVIKDDSNICVYAVRSKNGVIKCAFEQAYMAGKTKWKKPISCHLFPIIIRKKEDYEIMNYEPRSLCKAACSFGERLQIPMYEFLKEAIIRKYGEGFYNELDSIYKNKL
jgi:hypothetical protein